MQVPFSSTGKSSFLMGLEKVSVLMARDAAFMMFLYNFLCLLDAAIMIVWFLFDLMLNKEKELKKDKQIMILFVSFEIRNNQDRMKPEYLSKHQTVIHFVMSKGNLILLKVSLSFLCQTEGFRICFVSCGAHLIFLPRALDYPDDLNTATCKALFTYPWEV